MTAYEIKQEFLANLESYLRNLYPLGEVHGSQFRFGSLAGEKGASLRVELSGPKKGVWSDFAGGESGDIIDLFMRRNNFSRFKDASNALHLFLGKHTREEVKPVRTYKKPSTVIKKIKQGDGLAYLMKERGLSKEIIDDFKVWSEGRTVFFPYIDDAGELAMVKLRELDLDSDGKKVIKPTTTDCRKILFGMHTKLVTESKGIIGICEGEIDAMSWQQKGFPFVSVPFGAHGESKDGTSANDSWLENCYSFLDAYHTIYLSFDMDKAGEAAADYLIKRLGADRCLRVKLPHKDANACLQAGVDLKECIEMAETIDPMGISTGTSLADKVWQSIRLGKRELQGVVPLDWEGFDFRLREREGTIITGYQNDGKSNFCYLMMSWLASVKNDKVFIGSYEEPASQILGIMCNHVAGRQITGNEFEVFKRVRDKLLSNVVIHDHEGTVRYKEFFEHARYAVRRHGVRWVLLDGASCIDVNLDDNDQCANFVKECQHFWKGSGAHLFVICHPRKGFDKTKPPLILDIKGSGYFGDLFSNCLTAYRIPGTVGRGKIICSKQKVGGIQDEVDTYYDKSSMRLTLEHNEPIVPWISLAEEPF